MLDIIIVFVKNMVAGLVAAVPALFTRFLAATGLTLITFTSVLPQFKAFMSSFFGSLPSEASNLIGALGVDLCVSMILSAYAIKLSWKWFVIPRSVAENMPGVNL